MSSSSKPTYPGIEQFRDSLKVDYDLRTPPTGAQLGIQQGSSSAIFDRDGDYWTATFQLPDGKVFQTDRVFAVSPYLDDQNPNVSIPTKNTIGVQVRAENLADLRRRIREMTPLMGGEPDRIDAFLNFVGSSPATPTTSQYGLDLGSTSLAYLDVGFAASVSADRTSFVLTYNFAWDTPVPAGGDQGSGAPSKG